MVISRANVLADGDFCVPCACICSARRRRVARKVSALRLSCQSCEHHAGRTAQHSAASLREARVVGMMAMRSQGRCRANACACRATAEGL